MNKIFYLIAFVAIVMLVSCGQKSDSQQSADSASVRQPAMVVEDSIPVVGEPVRVKAKQRNYSGDLLKYMENRSGKLFIYKVGEKDGQVDVYTDLKLKLKQAFSVKGFNGTPSMQMSYAEGGQNKVVTIPMTATSISSLLEMLSSGCPDDQILVRFRGTIPVSDFNNLDKVETVSYNDMFFN